MREKTHKKPIPKKVLHDKTKNELKLFGFKFNLGVEINPQKKEIAVLAISFILIYGLIIGLLLPYLAFNNLTSWDTPGHVASAEYLKTQFFPDFSGWNPNSFGGFAQNYFYPPMFYYLVVLLSQVIPLVLAFKILVIISVLLIPYAVYFLARSFEIPREKAVLFMLFVCAFMLISTGFFGGNELEGKLYGTLAIGNSPAGLAIPLFFITLGVMNREFKKGKWVMSALLIAFCAMTHFFGFELFIGAIMIAIYLPTKEKFKAVRNAIITSLSLMLFWIIPFLLYHLEYVSAFNPLEYNIQTIVLIGITAILLANGFISKKINEVEYLVMGFLSFILLAGAIGAAFDVTRLGFILVVLVFLLITKYAKTKDLVFASIGWMALGVFAMMSLPIFSASTVSLYSNTSILESQRFIYLPTTEMINAHNPAYEIAKKTGGISLNGLFAENSLNARSIMDLTRAIHDKSAVWADAIIGQKMNLPVTNGMWDINKRLKRLGASYIITFESLQSFGEPIQIGEVNFFSDRKITDYAEWYSKKPVYVTLPVYAYYLGNTPLAEPITKPNFVNATIDEWHKMLIQPDWGEKMMNDGAGLETNSNLANANALDSEVNVLAPILKWKKAKGNEKITFFKNNLNSNKFSVNIDSQNDIPILIKVSYFPNWHAYVNGKEIKIYCAAPNMMVIYSHGKVQFGFEKNSLEYLALIVSIISFFVIVGKIISEKVWRKGIFEKLCG
ncbi:MAG: hypothetical protein NTY48_05720 [Candidatus Diapherotrites archaeon]|nr:hypothetical protein [Candidatus Diapherotrites archaeon]